MSEGETQNGESSVIRELRAKINELSPLASKAAELEQRAITAEEKATALEREKMTELERTAHELKDRDNKIGDLSKMVGELTTVKSKLDAFSATFEELYTAEIASFPEAVRENVQQLSSQGDWPDRLKSLRAARSLIPAESSSTGNGVQPPMNPGNPGGGAKPKSPTLEETAKNPSQTWAAAFAPKS